MTWAVEVVISALHFRLYQLPQELYSLSSKASASLNFSLTLSSIALASSLAAACVAAAEATALIWAQDASLGYKVHTARPNLLI